MCIRDSSSGISEESIEKLKNLGERLLVVVIPNFSIGASYQKLMSVILSDIFVNKDIIEKHHSYKKDAPSGTAIDLANNIIKIIMKLMSKSLKT